MRSDGVIQSCTSFASKLGNAIGGSLGIIALTAVGYIPNSEDLSQTVLTRMNMVINFAPAVLFILAAIAFLSVKMNKKIASENEKKIHTMIQEGSIK